MIEDYKIKGNTQKIEIEIEKQVIETLSEMVKYKKLSVSELTNTALKRFISNHKDFLPPKYDDKS